MHRGFSLKYGEYLHDAQKKKHYNEQLFTEVAPKYDLITRLLSLGRDSAWKRRLIAALPDLDGPQCVDLACGTGDLSSMLADRYPRGTVVGMDLTATMLELAARRNPPPNVSFIQKDMCVTDLPSHSVDIVTGGYALRNSPDLGRALEEAHRILKPGGVAAWLDFSKPPARFTAYLQYRLLKAWGDWWGLVLHGNPEIYGYIAASLKLFPNRAELRKQMETLGFRVVQSQRFYFGMVELLICERVGARATPARNSCATHPSARNLPSPAQANRGVP